MKLSRLRGKPGRWGLRTRLLLPIAFLVLIAAVGLIVINDFAARRQTTALLRARGDAVLQGINRAVEHRQGEAAQIAAFLATQPGVEPAMEQGDTAGLTTLLAPLKEQLGLQRIGIYSDGGEELLRLGDEITSADIQPIIFGSIANGPQSLGGGR